MTPSANSSHSYGLAADIDGLDGANGPKSLAFAKIAAANGLHSPYGPGNATEYNHIQLNAQPLERTPELLNSLKTAKATGNTQAYWDAYNNSATPGASGGATPGGGNDNRQLVYDTLTSPEIGLSPVQAMGVMASMAGESGATLSAKAYNPNDPHGAVGIAQWSGVRHDALQAFADQQGKNINDPQLQMDYLKSELLGSYRGTLNQIKGSNNQDDVTRITTKQFEVPHDADAKAEQRIAQSRNLGWLDESGKAVFNPNAKAISGGGGGATPPAGGSSTTPTPGWKPPTPEQSFDMSIGETLGQLAPTLNPGGQAGRSAPDVPIHTPAMDVPIAAPNPSPPEFGGSGVPSALAQMSQDPSTNVLTAANESAMPASLTAGAPSMSALLPSAVGQDASFNYLDPRRTVSPGTSFRGVRLS